MPRITIRVAACPFSYRHISHSPVSTNKHCHTFMMWNRFYYQQWYQQGGITQSQAQCHVVLSLLSVLSSTCTHSIPLQLFQDLRTSSSKTFAQGLSFAHWQLLFHNFHFCIVGCIQLNMLRADPFILCEFDTIMIWVLKIINKLLAQSHWWIIVLIPSMSSPPLLKLLSKGKCVLHTSSDSPVQPV